MPMAAMLLRTWLVVDYFSEVVENNSWMTRSQPRGAIFVLSGLNAKTWDAL